MEKVVLERAHGGQDGILCYLPSVLLLYREWI